MQQVVDFILELDKLKGVLRKVRPLGLDRYENSAEHSWQLALLAISLARYAEGPLDINRVIRMLLVHDVGEIDAGDVMFFAHVNWEERKAAERAAVIRIFKILPEEDSSDLLQLWHEFEAGESAESRFAHAVDRAMPVLLNLANQGQSWRENGISYERVVNRIAPPIQAGCPALWDYLQERLKEARDNGFFVASSK
ncbi:MAG TPA: HD domain-containing protein [Candidatus Acidoferrales bacterium]|jgi:putative hydrolase of HD superfamily|nr:HD domain-containing protein [Candidatus Acidoferrales bacterium]